LSKRRPPRISPSSGGILAAAHSAHAAARLGADPVNIGALIRPPAAWRKIGVGCVAAAKLAAEMVNEPAHQVARGAKLNLILPTCRSDTTVTRTETDRLITGNKLSAIHAVSPAP